MKYRMRAVCRARGTSLPTVGPGTSARMMCIERSPLMGMTAMRNTSTPMPPIQCVKLRQNRPERERLSMSFKIEAPVVVKPEVVSKKASTKWGMSPLIRKGTQPSSDIASHDRPTQVNPSRA